MSVTAPNLTPQEPSGLSIRLPYTIRVKNSFFRIGLICTVMFLTAQMGSVVAMFIDISGDHRIWAMLMIGVLWSPFVGLGLWLIATYRRASITLEDAGVRVTGVIRSRTLSLADITMARWSRYGTSLKLVSPHESCRIDFRDFRSCYWLELVRFFCDRLPRKVQHGWNEMWERSLNLPPDNCTLAEFNALLWRSSWIALPFGLVFGLGCGAYLRFIGGPESGSIAWLLLKWGSFGVVISLGFIASLWGAAWMVRGDVAE